MENMFDIKLDSLVRITVFLGGYFGGSEERNITFDGEDILVQRNFYNGSEPTEEEPYLGMKRKDMIEGLKLFHLDKWDPKYVDPYVLDGTQWFVELGFSDGTKWESIGNNAYPENFGPFMEFMQME